MNFRSLIGLYYLSPEKLDHLNKKRNELSEGITVDFKCDPNQNALFQSIKDCFHQKINIISGPVENILKYWPSYSLWEDKTCFLNEVDDLSVKLKINNLDQIFTIPMESSSYFSVFSKFYDFTNDQENFKSFVKTCKDRKEQISGSFTFSIEKPYNVIHNELITELIVKNLLMTIIGVLAKAENKELYKLIQQIMKFEDPLIIENIKNFELSKDIGYLYQILDHQHLTSYDFLNNKKTP